MDDLSIGTVIAYTWRNEPGKQVDKSTSTQGF